MLIVVWLLFDFNPFVECRVQTPAILTEEVEEEEGRDVVPNEINWIVCAEHN